MDAKTSFSTKASLTASFVGKKEKIFRACSGGSVMCVLVGCDGGRGISVSGVGGLCQVF